MVLAVKPRTDAVTQISAPIQTPNHPVHNVDIHGPTLCCRRGALAVLRRTTGTDAHLSSA